MDTQLAGHQENINGVMTNIKQLSEDQVQIITRMTGYKAKVCRCGENTDCLSSMSYGKPPVTSGSGGSSFPDGKSPAPLTVLPPATSGPVEDVPIPSSGASSLDKENSSPRSFQSAQQVVGELVVIVEADPEVDDKDAQALSDTMDAEVRSQFFQHCKSKQHPHQFTPFPKGWKADRACQQRRTFHPRLEVDRERFIRTRNLQEGLDGNADVESEHSRSHWGQTPVY